MNYTKGEWKAELRANDNIIRIKSTPLNSFQTHPIGEVYGTHGEDLANAQLISAAPGMYEALLTALGAVVALYIEKQTWGEGIMDTIKKALAKAEGK